MSERPEEFHRRVEERSSEAAIPPHSDLSNPVTDDPDMTEYPDPYETRPDPRDPDNPDPDARNQPSTSEPHPPQNIEQERGYSDK